MLLSSDLNNTNTFDFNTWKIMNWGGNFVIFRQRLLDNLSTRRDAEETKCVIRNRLSSDDDAIQMETLKMSLLCPVSDLFFQLLPLSVSQ